MALLAILEKIVGMVARALLHQTKYVFKSFVIDYKN